MSKFTRGPWQVENHLNQVGPFTSARYEIWSQNRHIATINEHVDDVSIDKANAALVAAAPEMLKQLVEILELFETKNLTSGFQKLDALIVKDLKQTISKAKGA